ncbi:hypothetical protein [Belliella aquatica]|uniref:Uncharacterized protein n=1 Tax=Belliella aquatica TaxID=1323734 RepID=A0ABQ1MRS1_9BACT|nr:hypothetical protein [Belliella aquatica]MCH7405959.1 hypothetical protein [Belliella aquatica]GGC43822.1 hypothetical protein GCM10010993_22910 [Belliella aquatica]
MKLDFDFILGIIISMGGLLLLILSFRNEPSKAKSESSKAASIQIKILGLGLFIGGLIYAF